MHPHHFSFRTVVLLTVAAILVSGSLNEGYSRSRKQENNHRKTVRQHRPRTVSHPKKTQRHRSPRQVYRHHRPARNNHYSYRRGRWFSVTPRARIAVGAPFGAVVLSLPGLFRTAVFGGFTYYYCDGVFYHRHAHGYEIVRAPRVRYLPRHARRVVISGNAYFLHDNFYYAYRDGFFEVCEPPVVVAEKEESPPVTTIMIENSNGSRTPVELEPMGANQWKGPKGEIYDGLPSDEQLREVYGL